MIVHPGVPEELRWFDQARFGMFVHFGVYALLGRGEWVMYDENIPREEYIKLGEQFNPVNFSAAEWVAIASEAGARYITVTAKHHDGFCLFDSEYTDWKITNTPFHRDLIADLTDACQRRGMKIIYYYSQPDWHHPNYVHNKGAFKDLDNPPESNQPDWDRYVEYYMGQVRELCTNYGQIDGIWFDGSHKTEEDWHGREVYEMIKELQPTAIVNDRARWGDMFTPERSLPEDLSDYLFEACESISPTAWGYQGETDQHSTPHLIRSLVRMASAGGNYLLNVGPAPDGSIPESQAQRMHDIGKWLERYGDSIYGTKAGPTFEDENIRATRRDQTLYVHMIEWPETNTVTIPTDGPVESASLLPYFTPLDVVNHEGTAEIKRLPSLPFDAAVNTICVDFAEGVDAPAPVVKPLEPKPTLTVTTDGETTLVADDAEVLGRGVKGGKLRVLVDAETERRYIDHWMVPDHAAVWNLHVEGAGDYEVSLSLWYREVTSGGVFRVEMGDTRLLVEVPETGESPRFDTYAAGTLSLPAGDVRLVVTPEQLKWGYIMPGLESVTLIRV
jgi:alpha-L-fucosidase